MASGSRRDQGQIGLDPLLRDERESEDWLDDHEIGNAWDIASVLVQAGMTSDHLVSLADELPAESLTDAIAWLSESLTARELIEISSRSSHRISELLTEVKGDSRMDRATEQVVDIHEGLDGTLLILGHRPRTMTVQREFDHTLPPIRVFGNSMNQVWTNMIDNAIGVTDEHGDITIRTRRDGANLIVEIQHNGAGIAPEDLNCIFEPFSPPSRRVSGPGSGSTPRGGMITVESEPGGTVFRVTLPPARARAAARARLLAERTEP